ncbi:MAG: Replication initiator RepC [uncultured bacterium]|nr:MAG: Replication initiator RepC [uncultured bacterium]
MRKAPYPTFLTPPKIDTHNESSNAPSACWEILDALAICRTKFGLTSASITVLRALLSFLPKTQDQRSDPFLVWPSNDALAKRADGMDERTLRRHLARLSEARLIERRGSPNGKRFALRFKNAVVTAYGFTLSPLFVRKFEILETAEAMRLESDLRDIERAQILDHLHRLGTQRLPTGEPILSAESDREIRKQLRRSIQANELVNIKKSLADLVQSCALEIELVSASNSQNDRHHQKTDKESLESVSDYQNELSVVSSNIDEARTKTGVDNLTLEDCLEAASESVAFSPEPVRTWRDLIKLGETLAPMIGIGSELMDHVRRAMGPLAASISVLCLVQRSSKISRPGAYLRALALRADAGEFSLNSLVRSAKRSRFAAVN